MASSITKTDRSQTDDGSTATSDSPTTAKPSTISLLVAFFLLVFLGWSAAQESASDPVVIETENSTVTRSEFLDQFEVAARASLLQQGMEPTEENLAPLEESRGAFLQQLASQVVLLNAARDRGVEASENEVDAYLDQLRQVNSGEGEFEEYLAMAGFADESELREQIGEIVTVQLFLEEEGEQLEPTDAEIDAWYEENQEQLPPEAEEDSEQVREQASAQLTQEALNQRVEELSAQYDLQVYPENL